MINIKEITRQQYTVVFGGMDPDIVEKGTQTIQPEILSSLHSSPNMHHPIPSPNTCHSIQSPNTHYSIRNTTPFTPQYGDACDDICCNPVYFVLTSFACIWGCFWLGGH